jgi:hypothetical protein
MVMQESFVSIEALDYDEATTRRLRACAAYVLLKHEFLLAMRWKPPAFGRLLSLTEQRA